MRRSLADLLTGLPNLAHLDLSGITNLTFQVYRTTLTF
jgi:hypothetical protein